MTAEVGDSFAFNITLIMRFFRFFVNYNGVFIHKPLLQPP